MLGATKILQTKKIGTYNKNYNKNSSNTIKVKVCFCVLNFPAEFVKARITRGRSRE